MKVNNLLIFFVMLMISCNENKDVIVDISSYNIPIKIINSDDKRVRLIQYFKKKGCSTPIIQKFWRNSDNVKFKQGTVEIEFLDYNDSLDKSINYEKNYKILISILYDSLSKSHSALYIKWRNQKLENGRVKWEINEDTDTIYSNLKKKDIVKVFKNFNGIVINENIDTIVTSIDYSVLDYDFYKNIKFIKKN